MFGNLKIGLRLGLGFGIILFLFAFMGIFSFLKMNTISNDVNSIVNDQYPKTVYCNDIIDQLNNVARALRNMALLTDSEKIADEDSRIPEAAAIVTDAMKKLNEAIKTDEEKRLMANLSEVRTKYIEKQTETRKLIKDNKKDLATALLIGDLRKAQNEYFTIIYDLIKLQDTKMKADGKKSISAIENTKIIIMTIIILSILIGIIAALIITKSITGPISRCIDIANKVAAGDTSTIIESTTKDETGQLLSAFGKMIASIKKLITDINFLASSAIDGKLATRADVNQHQGDYKSIVSGVNNTLDAVVNPLNVAAKYVEDISKGIIPAPISDNYNGDFNIIKKNLNTMVKMMENLLMETDGLVNAALTGALSTRANAGLFVGGWNQLVGGFNKTLDAILEPINEASNVLDKVAARDLTVRVNGDYKGDLAKIKNSLNLAVDNLDKALQQVSEATEQVTSASQQISSGSQSLAQGANEQASSLEEVSSSLEEMSSMTKQNAENAVQAKNLSGESDQNAKTGSEAMGRMSSAINRIKESSDQTAKIVKTIDEIAMQTNLLALNAAVEAARAGEAGRGFAVVAEEVRNLAQRSAQAAKNTADMISESVKNADDGVNIATEVSKSFDSIATSAKKVNDLIAEIAAASQEQSQGIDQVNTAVSQMDKVTQQNAANSEESASAAEELSSQAEELKTMIDQFALSYAVTQNKSINTVRTESKRRETAPVSAHNFHSDVKSSAAKKTSRKTIKNEDILNLDDNVLKEF